MSDAELNQKPLPAEDQNITLIAVREGNISVTSAKVLVVKPSAIALEVNTNVSEPPDWEDAQPVTLIYTHEDRVMRLRASVDERVSETRLLVKPIGDAMEGDRRDFRRADVAAKVYVERIAGTMADAREAQAVAITDSARFDDQTVNLSGSGVSFLSGLPFEAGDIVDVRLILSAPTTAHVSIIGRVVRVFDGDPLKKIAVRFAELSEAHQDILVYTVFSSHFESEGLADAFEDLKPGDAAQAE